MGLSRAPRSYVSGSLYSPSNKMFIWWKVSPVSFILCSLNAFEEELAYFWCQRIGTEYEESKIYRKNFS